jgi:EAL and modified HD-GYP domain-containing signal transduction protein
MAESARDPIAEAFPPGHRAKDFFLARQPILNREQNLVAYELLFRTTAAGPANVTDDLAATASVIAHLAELGMDNVIGASLAFINVDAVVLLSDFVQFLPKDKVVLEILETVDVTEAIVGRVGELAKAGYRFALDDVIAASEGMQALLPLVDVVKVDISQVDEQKLAALAQSVSRVGKKLLAEKVESQDQFRACLELGFDYFQGYYFAKPLVLSGKKLSPSQMTVMQLLAQITSEADNAAIEQSIKQDASLGLMLLRLVNTPAAGVAQRIDSIRQALSILGRRQLQRWLQILLYAEPGKPGGAMSPLLSLAATRGRLMELMAEKIRPGKRMIADTAFTVGILSLMDALFGLPMQDILGKLAVADEVRNALLSRSGIYGDMLALAESLEHLKEDAPKVSPLLGKLGLSSEEFSELQVGAYEWSDSVSHSAA